MTSPDFGIQLRRVRLAAGMSQSDLAEICMVPKSRLSRYENGHILPSVGTLRKLADALEVSESELLGSPQSIHETFFRTLAERDVQIKDHREAVQLAHRLADAISPVLRTQG